MIFNASTCDDRSVICAVRAEMFSSVGVTYTDVAESYGFELDGTDGY